MKILKKIFVWFIFVCMMIVMMSGCTGKKVSTEKITIDDVVQIPENGIITKEQMEAFAETERVIQFVGTSEGIQYTWSFSGEKIHNPQEMNLSIEFFRDNLEDIKKISGGASYAIGIKLKGKGFVTVPDLTIEVPEKWDADTAVFCKEKAGKALKMCDAEIETGEGTTTLSVKVTEGGDTCYIVAGRSKTSQVQSKTGDNIDESVQISSYEELTEEGAGLQTETTAPNKKTKKVQEKYDNSKSKDDRQNDKISKDNNNSDDSSKELTCTFSISCETILNHMDKLESSKKEFVPADGVLLKPVEVAIKKGDSVFDVLLSVCREKKIHMEHSYTPIYGSVYIEGIHQLYEFDCGELSGWMYKVDGWFPNYGCDKYTLFGGETIEIVYTCDLGKDVGDNMNDDE